MATYSWPQLYTGSWLITGNVAKVKVIHEIHRLISSGSRRSILDIGCVGLKPLELWEPLLTNYAPHFHLTGIDKFGIEKAKERVRQNGWSDYVILQEGNGYNLSAVFGKQIFDVVTATQVLEHVPRISLFMQELDAVLKPDGEGFLTLDSAYYRSRYDLRNPIRFVKNFIKNGLSMLGAERFYDLPWYDYEVVNVCRQRGLEILECRYYNLPILKFIHNYILAPNRKNAFMHLWFEIEEFLNEEKVLNGKGKRLFLGLYLHIRKKK